MGAENCQLVYKILNSMQILAYKILNGMQILYILQIKGHKRGY